MNKKPMDKVYGRLTLLGESKKIGTQLFEKCLCSCGTVKFISRNHLRRGLCKSCGCLNRELSSERLTKIITKHGMFGTKFYGSYYNIKDRCNNKKNNNYHNYGGRGIKCEWDTFEKFYNDMYESYVAHCKLYGKKNTTIERIDVNGNYCKENCKRATIKEQAFNKRSTLIFDYKGKKYNTKELSELTGLKDYVIRDRLRKGWNIKKIVEEPLHIEYRNKLSKNFLASK